MKSILLTFLISFITVESSNAQLNFNVNQKSFQYSKSINTYTKDFTNLHSLNKLLIKDKSKSSSSTLPIAIGLVSFLYLLNPIVPFENDKIGLGFTKEVSLGFGYFGEHRGSFEYSYIFRKDLNSNIRLGYKYDILLTRGLKPSNMFQSTTALSIGGGYFHNFSRPGYFAETSYGYSIRNHKILFYPSVKLRYTYVVKGANIIDFSFGIVIGIANPFIDLKIRDTERGDDD